MTFVTTHFFQPYIQYTISITLYKLYKHLHIIYKITQIVSVNEGSMENIADAIIFHTAICFGAKANSFYGRCEIACVNFSSPLHRKVAQK